MGYHRKKLLYHFVLLLCVHGNYTSTTKDNSPSANGIVEKKSIKLNEIIYENEENYRLPTSVLPVMYEIILSPDFDEEPFSLQGTVKIRAKVVEETDKIVLHVGKLDVNSLTVNDSDGTTLHTLQPFYSVKTEKFTIPLVKPIPKDTVIIIAIQYDGILMDHMIGFYKSSYYDEKKNLRWLGATQFQATHARHAFPCFDEPSFKAAFKINILRKSSQKSLSNAVFNHSENVTDATTNVTYIWDFYETTPIMSTYLVAFVVSDFESVTNDPKNFTVWSKPSAVDQTHYALKIGEKAIDYFAELFNEDYKLRKMDMIALPDFAAGAMENWGLITYKESRLLYDPTESSDSAQQIVASVIVHECAHMWFGNLVTPEWWDHLWLSEAFARYYQYFATAKIEPTWEMEQQFVVEQIQTAFYHDGLDSSKPLSRNVETQEDIGSIGDKITYNKGASIVRMMDHSFGSSEFNAGLRDYLKTRKWKSANPDDLWAALDRNIIPEVVNLNGTVSSVMNTWIKKSGYPVIDISIINNEVSLKQKRFFLRNLRGISTNITWSIPLTWTTRSERNFHSTKPKYWFNDENSKISVTKDRNEWIIFNVQQSGFYRVNYDENSWYRIINALNSENFHEIHEINRAALVDDLFNLARSELLNYTITLDGIKYLINETHYLPIKSAIAGFDYLTTRFAGQANEKLLTAFIMNLISKTYENLGFEDRVTDDRLTILLRAELNNLACKLEDDYCIENSKKYFTDWMNNKSTIIPKNQRPSVYCSAIRHGGFDEWKTLHDKYIASNCAAEQFVILNALACTKNKTTLEMYLLNAITSYKDTYIHEQDSITIFNAVSSSTLIGAEYILEFVDKYHSKMQEYYGNNETIADILSTASQHFSTIQLITKYKDFIETQKQSLASIHESLKKSYELAEFEFNWYNNNSITISNWIDGYNDEAVVTTTPEDVTDIVTDDFDQITTPEIPHDVNGYRLPTTIIPNNYAIRITPFITPGNFTFNGYVQITTAVVGNTDKVIFHSNDILFSAVALSVDGKHIKVKGIDQSSIYQTVTLILDEPVTAGSVLIIEISYTGILNTEMRGFYRSSYIDTENNTRWLAATHLEPLGARKMFPCFDEPGLKATFELSVSRPKDYEAISNTPVKTAVADDDRMLIEFEKTPVMSTYLLALVVSDFEFVQSKLIYSAYARPNAIEQANYAASVMPRIVEFFEGSLGHSYQLKKLDMIALPDFASGAMENWGLITYKERNMLYDENYSPITSKQAIINVIAHEIAHQWFGNLVSPEWWEYLWLSEGFARYFQYHATDRIEKDWGLASQFVVDHLQSAFKTDASLSTHPMTHPVNTQSEISGIFDVISYGKGASILRMFEKTFGTELFYNSLHDYLAVRQYTSARPEHLFAAFAARLNKTRIILEEPIETIMESWTKEPGYPVVNVKINNTNLEFTQERFLLRNPDGILNNQTWFIPITWTSQSSPDFTTTAPKFWFNSAAVSVYDPSLINETDGWMIFNVQQAGYYRVNYDKASWLKIIEALKSPDFREIHELNRASIIDDLLNLARADKVDYSIVLSLTEYLKQEINYIPWKSAFTGLSYLKKKFSDRSISELWKKHMEMILSPIYDKLGFMEPQNETHYDKLLRRYIINWSCDLNLRDCVNNSIKLFANWRNNANQLVPVNLRDTVYCYAIKYGSSDDWNFLWNKYETANVATEKKTILEALACSLNNEILDKLLISAVTENSGIKLQDSKHVFSSVYKSGVFGAKVVLNFFDKNLDKIHDYYGDYKNIKSIFSGILSQFSTRESVKEFERFVDKNTDKLSAIEKSIESRVKRAYEDLRWIDEHTPRIFQWLQSNYEILDYRLPGDIEPIDYDIYITPYFEERNFTFDGEVTIHMKIRKDTSIIVLHTNQLRIENIEVWGNLGEIHYFGTNWNEVTHKFTIYLTLTVSAGDKIYCNIKYSGVINGNMEGFYRSSYVDGHGNKRWLASTQFQSYGARQAFPCFDEPALKAKYRINIERPNGYHTLSNMPLLNFLPSETPNKTWDIYEESIVMSSYLVAFVVSDFESVTNEHRNFSVWARPNAIQDAFYALEVGQKCLKFLENYTDIEYPGKKMDFIAVPDFAAGAMENWGLVTFREYGLLSDNVTRASRLSYVNTIIAHELSHMWFGNLVTADWWEEIWLNEGFAQYFEYRVVDAIEPNWKLMDQFIVYELQKALLADSSSKMRPMNNKMETPYDSGENYGAIAYGKSASVIHMMRNAFGEEIFAQGLRYYLEQNKYKTSKPEKLWSALQISANEHGGLIYTNETIATLMDSWASQAGYPVVHASLREGLLTVQQKRFLLSKDNTSDDKIWWIPITIQTKSLEADNVNPIFWLGTKNETIEMDIGDDWFLLNVRQLGYYRVNYDRMSWIFLFNALNSKDFDGIHEINRAQIIDDALNLARAEELDYSIALVSTQYLWNETNHLPWKAFFTSIDYLTERFEGHESNDYLKDYVLKLINVVYEKIGFEERENDTFVDELNRELILTWACAYELADCVNKSRHYFDQWKNDETKLIPVNGKSAVYCEALKSGDYDDWKFLWNKYLEANIESEKIILLNALGCTRDVQALTEYLGIALSGDGVRDQNIYKIYTSIYSTDIYGVNFVFNYAMNNYRKISGGYGGLSTLKSLFRDVAGKFSKREQILRFEEFITVKGEELVDIIDSLKSSLNDAKINYKWFERNEGVIKKWLINPPLLIDTNEGTEGGNEVNVNNSGENQSNSVKWIVISSIGVGCVILGAIAVCLFVKRRRNI